MPGAHGGQILVGRRCYVSNLPWECTWQDLKDHFASAGNVVYADVMSDETGRSKGCGIVEFERPDEALRAIGTMSNTNLGGRNISVREDREDRELGGPPQHHGRQIVVHGIPYSMRWQDLKDLFKQCGNVLRADIVTDETGRSKGYGTILFDEAQCAHAAIATFSEQEYEGRKLSVKLDKFA
jgi:RNA recognition motif-containing protein